MRKQIQGKVLRNKTDKTIAVGVEFVWQHPKYHKRIRRVRTFLVHDENNEAKEGDLVVIEESRPVSKTKKWRLIEIQEVSK